MLDAGHLGLVFMLICDEPRSVDSGMQIEEDAFCPRPLLWGEVGRVKVDRYVGQLIAEYR